MSPQKYPVLLLVSLLSTTSLLQAQSDHSLRKILSVVGSGSDLDTSLILENEQEQESRHQDYLHAKNLSHQPHLPEKLEGLRLFESLAHMGHVLAHVSYIKTGGELLDTLKKEDAEVHNHVKKNMDEFYHKVVRSLGEKEKKSSKPLKNKHQYLLAKLHSHYGNVDEARSLFNDLLQKGYGPAQYLVSQNPHLHPKGMLTEEESLSLIQEATEASRSPSSKALIHMGDMARQQKDFESARRYYLKAYNTKEGRSYGAVGLGMLARQQDNNPAQALDYFLESADDHNPIGMISAALMYMSGEGVEADLAKAKNYLKRCVKEHHNPTAAALLAQLYLEGRGVKVNPDKARYYLNIALKHDDPYGHCVEGLNLKEQYLKGEMKDEALFEKAKAHLEMASTLHISEADVGLGELYLLRGQPHLAEDCFVRGHERDNMNATYSLGVLYKDMLTEADHKHLALQLLVQAGQHGIPMASIQAAEIQRELQNTAQEFHLLQEAFRQSPIDSEPYKIAAERLGHMYKEGMAFDDQGAPVQDMDRAQEFLELAK
jgi:TPR repeat protein